MVDSPLRSELFARARAAALATANTPISAEEIDRPGSDVNLVMAAIALVGEEIVHRGVRQYAGVFEDSARGTALDRVVFDRKRLPRKPAAPAVGQVVLSRPTFAGGSGTVIGGLPGSTPSPTRIQTNQGIVYTITTPVAFGVFDLGPFAVDVQAELAGFASQVGRDQQWSFIDPPFDTSITIANPVTMAGAAEEETDSEYIGRSKAFFPTLRRGVRGAIEFGLLSVPGIASVSVSEILQPGTGMPAAVVTAFVLDSRGQSNQTLAARGSLGLLDYRAFGIPVIVLPGAPEYVSIRLLPTWDTAIVLDTVTATTEMKQAIVTALDMQQPGQLLERATIIAAAKTTPGLILSADRLLEPPGDLVAASSDRAFRTLFELVQTV